MMRRCLLAIVLLTPRAAAAEPEEVIEVVGRAPPGAECTVDEAVLEREEHDDIHKVLRAVAGVYVRDEDGYGLRPNIGMRGAAADRSAKIALLEDGVPIAPAPYSAPAAYYFPLVTRMAKVDVIKGPAAIRFGPNTVGGAVDLIGQPMPTERTGYLDVAGGADRYGKLHGRVGDAGARWAAMAEFVKLRTGGFKDIDGGGPSGFDKDDAQLSLRLHTDPARRVVHRVDLRAGWSDETSHETYTGLSDADFAAAPQRRYVATQLDRMDWDHWRFRAVHHVDLGLHTRIETIAYRHDFHRVWGKVDAFVGDRDLAGILADPAAGAHAIYYAVLTGAADTSSPEDELIRGINDRTFVSEGVQSALTAERTQDALFHQFDAGLRLHHDAVHRLRCEDGYRMMQGELVRSDRPRETALDAIVATTALAAYARDQVRWRNVEVTAGARLELIDASAGTYAVPIPGGGVQVHATERLALLAGVHRGFVPATGTTRPESSVNYEAGGRWRSAHVAADLIGFFSDYSNLKGTCTQSSGCDAGMLDDEYDGGRVHVRGAEAQVALDLDLGGGLHAPLTGAYTFTGSAFRHGFASEFAGWGAVEVGDELPYLPPHQASLAAAVEAPHWTIGGAASWHAAARDLPGQGAIAADERGDSLLTIDVSMHLRFHPRAELYLTCDNLLDEQVVVARRPYGVRPNAPRLFTLGYKARF
jgi:Fe(3+) dicitrate transport protein